MIILASTSPRRRELLARLIPDFPVQPADIDETPAPEEAPADYVCRLALEKARATGNQRPGAWVIGSDTAVVVDGLILGKPADAAEARRMLEKLSGRWHQVMSAVALVGNGFGQTRLNVTEVRFAPLPPAWIEAYIESGEPMDKAGAYGIQDTAAAWIPEIRGSHSAVMGLPLFETAELLREIGLT